MSLPNWLTTLRILLIPALVFTFYLPGKLGHVLATIIFAVASLTDSMDGYLARNLKQETKFGAFLDPVADKLIISVALLLIVAEIGTLYIVIPSAIIICREITISALREWMSELGKRTSVAVTYLGKVKTFLQMFAIAILLYQLPQQPVDRIFYLVGLYLLYLAAGITLWTMFLYLRAAWTDLTNTK